MRRTIIIWLAVLAVMAGCGQSHHAQGVVKKFMKEQMGVDDYDAIAWSNIDSTFHVSDSMLNAMQLTAEHQKVTRKGTVYQPRTEKLHIITLEYRQGKDTLMRTFYLDDKMQGVVGVKAGVFSVSGK